MEELAPSRHLIITVHGIRTFGHWQERLEALVLERDPCARVQHYKYGYFSCAAFLVPPLRWWVTRRFRHALVAACNGSSWGRIDIVAHSFGTHLVAWGLHGIRRGERPRIHTLILAGSVLKPSFAWQELTDGCVDRVVNDCGTRDGVLVLNQGIVLFTGMAGRVGFAGMSHDRFRNRYFAHGHSGYFLREGRESDEFMRTWWLPVLCSEEPLVAPVDPREASALEGLLTFALNNAEPIKVALFVAPLVFLTLLFFALYRQADTQRRAARQRLLELFVASGQRQSDDGDLSCALVWVAEALRVSDDLAERDQRVRYSTALQQHPALTSVLFLAGWPPRLAASSPDGSLLALAGGWSGTEGARVWDVETGNASELFAHSNTVSSIAWSPDGARLATASNDHTARVWDARTGAPLTPPLEHDAQLTLVRFGPDGELLLTVGRAGGDGRHRASVWGSRSADEVRATLAHADTIGDAAFSPDGRRVVTISADGTSRIWDSASGEATCPPLSSGAHLVGSLCARFSSDGDRVVTSNGEEIRVWDAATGDPLGGPWDVPRCARVEFADADTVLGVDGQGTTGLWSVRENGSVAGPLRHGGQQAGALSISDPLGDRQLLAFAAGDGSVRVWNAWDDRPVTPALSHSGAVTFTEIDDDGRRLVTIDVTGIVRIWDLSRAAAVVLDHGPSLDRSEVWEASFGPDGARTLSIAGEPRTVHLWDSATGEHAAELSQAHDVESALFSPDGRRVLTWGRDGMAQVWDARTAEPAGVAMQHGGRVSTAAFSSDGSRLVTGGDDGIARAWSAIDGRPLFTPIEYGPPIVQVAFGPDGRSVMVAGGASGKLYDLRTGARVTGGPRQNEEGLEAAALSPDGLRIATGGLDGIARVWDASTGEPITPPLVHSAGPKYANLSQRVTSVTFSGDSRWLATSSADSTTRVWDATTGAPAGPPLVGADQHAAFSPDGRWIATAGSSGVARVWDVRTGAAICPPLVHESAATHVAFAPDGLRLVSASLDGTARIWSLAPEARGPDELRTLAEVLACRRIDETGGVVDLTPEELRTRWNSLRAEGHR